MKNNYLLIFILLCAGIVRYWGIGFGLPNTNCRPDESMIVNIVYSPMHNFNPGHFNYPSFYKYLNLCFYGLYFIFGLLTGKFRSPSDFYGEIAATNCKDLYLIDRLLSASFGVATVFICYKIAEKFFDRKTAIISSFFLSLTYLHVRDSHFGTVDVPMVFFIMCSMLFIIKCYEDNLTRNYIFAGIFAGLAASTKYIGILSIMPMFIVNGLSMRAARSEAKAPFFGKKMLFFIIALITTFLIGTPYAVLDFTHLVKDLLSVARYFNNGNHIIFERGWWYYLRFCLPVGMGFSLFFTALAGVMLLIKKDFKKAIILFSFPLLYYAIMGKGYGVFARYIVPVVPYLCIAAAMFTVYIINRIRKYLTPNLYRIVILVLPILIVLPSVYNVLHLDILLSRKDNRLVAAEWVNTNLPAGSSIAFFGSKYGRLQLFPAVKPLEKNNIKGFNEYYYDEQLKRFKYNNELTDMPRYIILSESPWKLYNRMGEKEILEKFYYILAEFKAINIYNKSNLFDKGDAFYLPLLGFKEIQRPGPNIYIYEKK